MLQDIIVCLKEATAYFILRKHVTPQEPAECFRNSPCDCANPGKDMKCEDCPYLEACLSNCKVHQTPHFRLIKAHKTLQIENKIPVSKIAN